MAAQTQVEKLQNAIKALFESWRRSVVLKRNGHSYYESLQTRLALAEGDLEWAKARVTFFKECIQFSAAPTTEVKMRFSEKELFCEVVGITSLSEAS